MTARPEDADELSPVPGSEDLRSPADTESPMPDRPLGEIGVLPPGPEHDPADDRLLGEIGVLPEGGEAEPRDVKDRAIGEVGQLPGVPLAE